MDSTSCIQARKSWLAGFIVKLPVPSLESRVSSFRIIRNPKP